MRKYKIYGFLIALSIILVSCYDHEPKIEELPNPDLAFNYSVIDNTYQLDYYVGATIEFRNSSAIAGECTWDFGDGTTANGNVVTHKYPVAGTYSVKLTVSDKGFIAQNIFISDIRPILTIDPIEGGICEVRKTLINISVDLPNPEGLSEEYTWIFPEGTENEAGQEITTFIGKNPGKLRFNHVGSQTVRLQTRLGSRLLEEGLRRVPVGYSEPVPTLYYAVKKGNIMALKLVSNVPAGMKINPFDMGVKSGEHPLNILFDDQTLYILDCGKQFTFVDDETRRDQGDGRIFVMSKDGSEVSNMLSNGGQYAFDDPYYGYIESGQLYFTDRRTGIAKIDVRERNRVLSRTEFPFFVENAKLGYYNSGLAFGATNACIGKVNGIWYWCKTYSGEGIFRFTESDILSSALGSGQSAPHPAAGWVLRNLHVKSFVWDDVRRVFYFSLWTTGMEGVYRCTLDELNGITATAASLAPYKLTFANGKSAIPSITGTIENVGSSGEYIAICQLALDRTTGAVYFGLRSGDLDTRSGLIRYNPVSGKLEHVPGTEGIEIYGVAVNNAPSKLF